MEKTSIYGNWRALVVDNKDKEKHGRVLVWIPDLMPEVDRDKGIWARPANNPLGGRNMEGNSDHYYMGSSFIPKKGSWLFIFFEGGNINRPYYFGALDLENTKVLPENQVGTNYEDKWTLFKSHKGRAIVVSDDDGANGDERVEITGKKRQIKTPPTGDTDSVYTIDGNQTTILFDERNGKEKILIRTYKGDFLHIDIDEQKLQAYFKSDFDLKCDGDFYLTVNGDINIKSLAGDAYVSAASGDINIKASGDYKQEAGGSSNHRSQVSSNTEAGQNINHKAGTNVNDDAGGNVNEQTGSASSAQSASSALEAHPQGERDT